MSETPQKEKKEFHTQGFDGPLDLLLYLIQENKVNIYNIDISLITEQFLEYIAEHEAELGELSDFYKTAAELLYIKSKMLLPVTAELDETYEDPREELVEKLIEYQMYKKYTELLINGGSSDRLYINRNENFFAVPYEDSDLFEGVTLNQLLETFVTLASKTKPAKIFNVYEEVSIDEKETLLNELLDVREMVSLDELIVHLDDKMHIICSFLAILKMTTEKTILLYQAEEFGPILIKRREDGWIPDIREPEDIAPAKGKPESYSVLTQEAIAAIKAEEARDEEKAEPEEVFIGEEEEIDLGDDDEED